MHVHWPVICYLCITQQSRKRRCLEQGVIFDDDDEEEVERADQGAQNWTVELSSQAKAEGSLSPTECCVSIWVVFSIWALVECLP